MISTEKKQPIIQHIMPPKSNFDMGEENPSNSSIDLHSFFKPSKQESEVPLGVDKMNQQINLKEYGSEDRTIANENAENTKFFSSPVGLIFKNKEGIHEEIKGEPNQHFVEDRLDMSSDDEEKVNFRNY